MHTNRSIDASRRIYACLLYLYPPEHRNEYGDAMLQLFSDQCRSAFQQWGRAGLASLWLRTLFDLGLSVLSEHLSAPGSKWGLLEAMPNKPLPWKGVALVLVPGLILFVGQVAQMSGENWFFMVLTWAPYILMAIVLLVWLITRRYPIWGLMPLGLLSSNLVYYASRLVTTWQLGFYRGPDNLRLYIAIFSNGVNRLQSTYSWMVARDGSWVLGLGCVLLMIPALLIMAGLRRQPLPRVTWILLGVYLLLSLVQLLIKMQNYLDSMRIYGSNPILYYDVLMNGDLTTAGTYAPVGKIIVGFWTLYGAGAFLALIVAGTRLARRSGDLAILFPLGYVLGAIVYGYYNSYEDTLLYLVVGVVLLYRLLIALVAPVWISRSAGRHRDWALAVSIGLAFGAQIILREITVNYFFFQVSGNSADVVTPAMHLTIFLDPLVVAVGLALAISLYRQAMPASSMDQSTPAPLNEAAPQ